jgi:hypothetical protein
VPGDDTCQVEPDKFGRFAQAAFDHYLSSNHGVLRALLHGQLLVTLVPANDIGRPVLPSSPEGRTLLTEAAVPPSHDGPCVSVGATRTGAIEMRVGTERVRANGLG